MFVARLPGMGRHLGGGASDAAAAADQGAERAMFSRGGPEGFVAHQELAQCVRGPGKDGRCGDGALKLLSG